MKTAVKQILFIVEIILLFLCPNAFTKESYSLGFYMNITADYEANAKQFWEDFTKAVNNAGHLKIQFVWVNNREKFIESAGNKDFDIMYSTDIDILYDILKTSYYIPFITLSFNKSISSRLCLYVRKSDDIRVIDDLKNKRATIMNTLFDYIILLKLVKMSPLNYFSELQPSNDAFSIYYSLSLGNTDCILSSESSFDFLSMTNPGVTKKVKSIFCSDFLFIQYPALYLTTLETDEINGIAGILKNSSKNPDLKKYQGLFKMTNSSFVSVGYDDYKPLMNLYNEAIEKGWDTDYDKWREKYYEK